jgi:hypothetical protein
VRVKGENYRRKTCVLISNICCSFQSMLDSYSRLMFYEGEIKSYSIKTDTKQEKEKRQMLEC